MEPTKVVVRYANGTVVKGEGSIRRENHEMEKKEVPGMQGPLMKGGYLLKGGIYCCSKNYAIA